jgi:hypothetical protein
MGQLAYDKGMKILAASQANDVALEVAGLRQGLLTYALVREGLEKKSADIDGDGRTTLDEWLEYAAGRVPTLFADIKAGRAEEIRKKDIKITAVVQAGSPKKSTYQQPQLFDFLRRKSDVVIAERSKAAGTESASSP